MKITSLGFNLLHTLQPLRTFVEKYWLLYVIGYFHFVNKRGNSFLYQGRLNLILHARLMANYSFFFLDAIQVPSDVSSKDEQSETQVSP